MRTFGLNTGVGGNKKKASVLLGIVRFEYCPKNYESGIGEVRSLIHSKFGEVQGVFLGMFDVWFKLSKLKKSDSMHRFD